MKSEPKLVGLFGLFGVGNIGNDGSLESMVRFLRRVAPQQGLLCICGGDTVVVGRALDLEVVPIWRKPRSSGGRRAMALLQSVAGKATIWLHAFNNLRRLKVLIVPGMGILDDFGVRPLGWPYNLLTWCLLGRLMGVKVIFASIGAGPIDHPFSRWFMKWAARAAHYRSYRDTLSKTFMESIGFDARSDPIYPDIAFRLPAPPSTNRVGDDGRPLTIGVGVMAYCGWHNDVARGAQIYHAYLQKMTGFVTWLLDRGHVVRLVIGDDSDLRAVDDLVAAVRSSRPDRTDDSMLFAPAYTLRDVMQQMAGTDIVVATRYHNVVCALRIGKPTISIGYARKNDVLLAEMGLGDYCQHIERLDVDLLKTQTARLISDRRAIEHRVREAGDRFQSRLREQEDLLASLIASASSSVWGTRPLDVREPVT